VTSDKGQVTAVNVIPGGANTQKTGCVAPPPLPSVHHSRSLVHGVLREGQAVRVGRLAVEASEMALTVSIGGVPLVVLSRFGDAWQFCARPFGPAHPELLPLACPRGSVQSETPIPISTAPFGVRQRAEVAGETGPLPLVRLGPGGSYTRDIYKVAPDGNRGHDPALPGGAN